MGFLKVLLIILFVYLIGVSIYYVIKLPVKNIKVEGIYTHFSSADNDSDYTEKQFEIFRDAVEITKNYFPLKYIHCLLLVQPVPVDGHRYLS